MEDKENRKLAYYSFGRFQSAGLDSREIMNKKDWVSWGPKNDFPQELIRNYKDSSSIHKSLVDRAAQMTAGGGWNQDLIVSVKGKLFFKNRFSKDTLDQVALKSSFDLALSNLFYLNVVWDETGTNIAKIEHIPFERVRAQKCISDEQTINFWVSRNWEDSRKGANKPRLVPGFSPALARQEGEEGKSQILAVIVPAPGMDYYSIPLYNASLTAIKGMYELNNFHLKSVQNGFQPGMLIIHKGEYTPEEQDEIYADMQRQSGTDEAGVNLMMFVPNEESMPTVEPIILQDSDDRYLLLKDSWTEEIIQGHQANPIVAGLATAGSLSSGKEVQEQYDAFQKTVISPAQKIIEDVFNMLAKINEITDVYELNTFKIIDEEEVEVVDAAAQAKATLRSSESGIKGILAIQKSVFDGFTTFESGVAILELIYGLESSEARQILGQPEVAPEINDNI